ncbi:hypothetical protein [Nocardia xishanensis]|uniref:Uncharacterized protein n=1 Tax=Nocardia xishanensis TaxID=238964 RepID=A0ABW7WX88_9NOCA
MSAPDRRREHAALEAEYQRLDTVQDLMFDMLSAAGDTSAAKGFRDNDFESSRTQYAARKHAEVYVEKSAVWDRLLDYRHGSEMAVKIRAEIAAGRADREQRERSRGIERSR